MHWLFLAAALAIAAGLAVAAAGGLFERHLAVLPPPRASMPTTGPEPTPRTGAPAWEGVYLRRDPGSSSIDVLAVRPDGSERLIRSIPSAILGAAGTLAPTGRVSPSGWLYLYESGFESGANGEIAILDLAHPDAAVTFLTFGAPLGPRWSSTDMLAVPGYGPGRNSAYELWSRITVLNPRTGETTDLGSLGLFGGGPSIVWAQDGSGILDFGRLKPVDGSGDIAIDPNLPFDDPRVGVGAATILVCRPAPNSGDCPTSHGSKIQVRTLGGASVTDWYVNPDDAMQPVQAIFGADGRTLFVAFEDTSTSPHRAVIARIDAPGHVVPLASWNLPAGAYEPAIEAMPPDASHFELSYSTGPSTEPQPNTGPSLGVGGTLTRQPDGFLAGWVPGPRAESWPAEGDFGPTATELLQP